MKLILIALSMACSDIIGTSLVIAESTGKAYRAGVLDALGDISGLVYLALGVTAIDSWNWHSVITLTVVCATSFVTTAITIKMESRARRKFGQRGKLASPMDLASSNDVL